MHWMTCFLYGNQFYNTRKHWRCSLLPEIFTSEGSTGCYAWSKRWKEHNDDLLLYLFCLIIFHLFEEVWRDSVFRLRFFFCISPVGTLAVTELSLDLSPWQGEKKKKNTQPTGRQKREKKQTDKKTKTKTNKQKTTLPSNSAARPATESD